MSTIGSPLLNLPRAKCVTFSNTSDFTLSIADSSRLWDGTVEYSTDLISWSAWNGNEVLHPALHDGEYVLFVRGANNTQITGVNAAADVGSWKTDVPVTVSGPLGALLDWRKEYYGISHTLAERGMAALFASASAQSGGPQDASGLVLPAVTSASGYRLMFSQCTNLTGAPVMPATTLSEYCYYGMFQLCTSLVTAPQLPATTMASYSYAYMFYNCSALVNEPQLPATTLADYCYYSMFGGCTNVTRVHAFYALHYPIACLARMYRNTGVNIAKAQSSSYNYRFRIPVTGTATYYNVSASDSTYPSYAIARSSDDPNAMRWPTINDDGASYYCYVAKPLIYPN